jgi:DNA-binding NarL/FixJ family response regulator
MPAAFGRPLDVGPPRVRHLAKSMIEEQSNGSVLILEEGDSIKASLSERLGAQGMATQLGSPDARGETLARNHYFDAVVLAVPEMHAFHFEFIERMREDKRRAAPEIVALVENPSVDGAVKAMRLGAYYVMTRPCRIRDLEERVREAVQVRRKRAKGRLEEAFGRFADGGSLTRREIDIVRALALGMSNRAIADSLRITEHTVKTHLKNIFSKLKAGSRTEILSLVFRLLDESE